MIKNLAMPGFGNRKLLLLALLLGLTTAMLMGIYLKGLDSGGGGSGSGSVNVVVAARDIPALTQVTAEMVTLKPLPASAVIAGAFRDQSQVLGQVFKVDIAAGEQLLPAKVAAADQVAQTTFGVNTPLSLLIPEGKRAFSVFTSKIGSVGGLVRAGDYVDLLLSGPRQSGGEGFLTPGSACYVLQDVQVLALGANIKTQSSESEESALAASASGGDSSTATLAVTAEETWWLAAAQQSVGSGGVGNQLWMSLRPFGNHGQATDLPLCGVAPGS